MQLKKFKCNNKRMTATKIWYEDPVGFMSKLEHWYTFIPLPSMTLAEKLNAILRFAIYYSILLLAFKGSVKMVFVVIFVMAVTFFVYHVDSRQRSDMTNLMNKEGLETDPQTKKVCRAPTSQNPFMNVMSGQEESTKGVPACDITRPVIEKKVERLFDDPAIYGEHGGKDIFGRNIAERAFYTAPSSTSPNDQKGFANWLYNDPTISTNNKKKYS
jgi:hypothetical protein